MVTIRAAALSDAAELIKIYNPYILNTTVTYEYEPVTATAFAGRMAATMEGFPYLVAEDDGQLVGYAYASPYHGRRAYSWSCELSVYVDMNYRGRGVGSAFYSRLLDILEKMNYVNVYSLVDYPNDGSMALHKKFGFTEVVLFKNTAYKLGHWLDMMVLEKRIGTLDTPKEIDRDWRKFL